MLPLVSVLIPLYNCENYIFETIESVLAQTYKKIEVIIVDDGSTDNGLLIAKQFQNDRVKIITQANYGQSAAYNTAFLSSTGDFIQYLDADDLLHPGKIDSQVDRLLSNNDPNAIASGMWARFTNKPDQATFKAEPIWRDLDPIEWIIRSWSGQGMMHVGAWLIPRAIVAAAGPWIECFRYAPNIDADFFTRVLLRSSMCIFCEKAKSYYRGVPLSQSTLANRRNIESAYDVLIATGEQLLRHESSARTRSAYADNLMRFVYSYYPEHLDLVRSAELRIEELGGSSLPFSAGRMTRALSKLTGWRIAKRSRNLINIQLSNSTRYGPSDLS